MFIAPLNYDRFFKKVFSNLDIAKAFLEDFFEEEIESIEMLPLRHRLTDEAMVVEFDYRCKINDRSVLVDMQQWFKVDVAKRFYLYHCLNSALQLESLGEKSIPVGGGKKHTDRDYSRLEPTVTLIWMVDDTLESNEPLLSYILLPDMVLEMLQNDQLWRNAAQGLLLEERERTINVMSKPRKLSFLGKNKLIFAFQKNIVRSKKYAKLVRWFRFAEASRNKNNKEDDFKEYLKDKIFMQVIERLRKETLAKEDFEYITDYEKFNEEYKRYVESWKREAQSDIREELRPEVREELRPEVREEVIIEHVKSLLKNGVSPEMVALYLNLPIKQVEEIASQLGKTD